MKKLRKITLIGLIALPLFSFGQKEAYFMSKVLEVGYEEAIVKIENAAKEQGFGVVNKLLMHETLSSKIPDIKMDPYIVLGVCNAPIAWESIQKEPNIGVFLPCKVIIKYVSDNSSEVVIVNPSVTMSVIDNPDIQKTAMEITGKLEAVLNNL